MSTELHERRSAEHLTDDEWRPTTTTTTLPERATLSGRGRSYQFVGVRSPHIGSVITVPLATPDWVLPTLQGLSSLLDLPSGWDSYGAPSIEPGCVDAAFQLAAEVMKVNTPLPSVVPTSRGGVQLEWHTRGIDLEVEFLTPARIHGLFQDHQTDDSWEADLTFDVKRLTDAISLLSRRF